MRSPSVLYLVVPCYNEEEALPLTSTELVRKLDSLIERGAISEASRILYVNDGSKDGTWNIIRNETEAHDRVIGLNLSRNRGHQNAVLAGMMWARHRADAVITLDADLQDDPDAIDRMVEEYRAGSEIVYGVRSSRKTDTFFKRVTAESFYRILASAGVETVFNHADYRLMSKRALDGLAEFKEVNLFLRGIVPMIGYRTSTVEYERNERVAGESKYPLSKMFALAIEGITSLSVKPLRFVTGLGFVVFALSIVMLIWAIVQFFFNATIVGWASVMVSVWALGGLILLAIGIVGEYVGKIYLESKARPRFRIADVAEHGTVRQADGEGSVITPPKDAASA